MTRQPKLEDPGKVDALSYHSPSTALLGGIDNLLESPRMYHSSQPSAYPALLVIRESKIPEANFNTMLTVSKIQAGFTLPGTRTGQKGLHRGKL